LSNYDLSECYDLYHMALERCLKLDNWW
jgi:hypothetical protein